MAGKMTQSSIYSYANFRTLARIATQFPFSLAPGRRNNKTISALSNFPVAKDVVHRLLVNVLIPVALKIRGRSNERTQSLLSIEERGVPTNNSIRVHYEGIVAC